MGIISVLAFVVAFILLAIFRSSLKKQARDFERGDPENTALVWASRGCLIVMILAVVGAVDSYVYKLPNPFSGPKVGNEMPQSSPPPPTPVKPDVKADDLRPDMEDVKKEHRDQLKEFEQGPPPAEQPQ
jgi:hypothetical protein